jgi:hypothetical protein
MPSEDFTKKKEATRKLLGAALCDLVAYIGSAKESFVIGGQYPNDRLIKVFREWLNERRFDIEGSSDLGKVWLDAGKQGIFCPKEGLPPLTPKAPKKPRKPPVSPPVDDSEPDDGYFKEDSWKPEEDRKDHWTDEGEDWKDDGWKKDGDQDKGGRDEEDTTLSG